MSEQIDFLEIKKAIAEGLVLKDQVEKSIDYTIETIEQSFNLLLKIHPSIAYGVLQQLNRRLTKEELRTVSDSIEKRLERITKNIVVPREDVEGIDE